MSGRSSTAHILPTFINAPGNDYARAIAAVREAIAQGLPGILGLHLEGPFLSPDRPDIHDAGAIRPCGSDDIDALIAAGIDPLLLTLAPEELAPDALARLSADGIRVFAGHTAATAATAPRRQISSSSTNRAFS